MSFFRKKFGWAVVYVVLLTAFTLYVVLDTFVIQRVYTVVPSESGGAVVSGQTESGTSGSAQTEQSGGNETSDGETSSAASAQSAVVTDHSYLDSNISITITEYREYDTTIFVADVTVSSPEYLNTALAKQAYGQNITEPTSEIALENQAILAINGDYYGTQRSGYVLRNGVLYRESAQDGQEDLVIWADGSFELISEGEVSASDLLKQGAVQILSFGPGLVDDGTISVSEQEEVGKAKASNPRTAIGIVDDLHYVFVVSDGRTQESTGLSLYQLAEFMQGLGVKTAYNLDGGGSSTMYFNGSVINNPTTNGNTIKERSVSDIVYIGS
ncbi:MAG: phosphodiester glycosidase family protein [Lawsonibacter sp.]